MSTARSLSRPWVMIEAGVVTKLERNAPCPCGSGNKYKKCCLPKDRVEAAQHWAQQEAELQAARKARWARTYDSELDELNDHVIEHLESGRYEEALNTCQVLLDKFPEVIDGLDYYAQTYEAMGKLEEARDYYQRALDFTERPDQRDGFDEDGRAWRREDLAKVEAKLARAQATQNVP